jgi:hypothetical protein
MAIAVKRLAIIALLSSAAIVGPRLRAQSPTYGVGHPPTADDLKKIDIEVTPDGKGLRPGSSTAAAG